ncbi:MAG: adenylate/guanylate cyclase domain-containing protein [Desulfomonilaceae bacterium]
MIDKTISPATVLVKATAAINVLGNFFGVLLTLIYFGIFHTGLTPESVTESLLAKTSIVVAAWLSAVAVIGPINLSWVIPLVREVKKKLQPYGDSAVGQSDTQALRVLAGNLLKLPAKLAATTLVGWVIAAITFFVLAHVVSPDLYPWTRDTSGRVAASMVLISAPLTASWIFFFQERWIRIHMRKFFPPRALLATPITFRINVLPKMLIVSLVITTLPLAMIGHVTLSQIQQIQAGQQPIENFISHMPSLIWFLLVVFILAAVGLSVFMARSVSEPLQTFESAMETFRKGDLDASVPVFSNDEIGRTGEGFNSMVEEHRNLDSIRETFGTYLSAEVVNEILKSPGGVELRGELREITILVSDIRGFTRTTELLRPGQVLEMLNRYLEEMTDIIMKHGGTIDEFTGDGILVFFGAPTFVPDHCMRAVACALEMQKAMGGLNRGNLRLSLPQLQMGIGVNSGQLIVGNIGSEKRRKYGAVGSPINLAFRIQSEAEGGEVLVSPAVFHDLGGELLVEGTKQCSLKGIEEAIVLHRVEGLRRKDGLSRPPAKS